MVFYGFLPEKEIKIGPENCFGPLLVLKIP